jgi:hypothetical protein
MPIEIKELIIRASVRETSGRMEEKGGNEAARISSSQEEQIVTRCVDQIMEILRIQNER